MKEIGPKGLRDGKDVSRSQTLPRTVYFLGRVLGWPGRSWVGLCRPVPFPFPSPQAEKEAKEGGTFSNSLLFITLILKWGQEER